MTQRALDDVLDDALRRGLSPCPDTIPAPTPEAPASHHAAELALARHNYKVFKQQLPELLKEHADEYVAFRNGKIAGFGQDKKALWHQIREQYGPGGILVMQVTETPRVINVTLRSVRKVK
jgi:hypothetical protein